MLTLGEVVNGTRDFGGKKAHTDTALPLSRVRSPHFKYDPFQGPNKLGITFYYKKGWLVFLEVGVGVSAHSL